jgi:hypothetical protein
MVRFSLSCWDNFFLYVRLLFIAYLLLDLFNLALCPSRPPNVVFVIPPLMCDIVNKPHNLQINLLLRYKISLIQKLPMKGSFVQSISQDAKGVVMLHCRENIMRHGPKQVRSP